jgi:hypothetical protein
MRARRFLARLSKRAPDIVILTLCVALLGAWTGAPAWLANALAILVAALALGVLATRRRRYPVRIPEEADSSEDRSWLTDELAGRRTPLGTYLLVFFGFLTVMLIGFDSPFGTLAWAGFALAVAWSIANTHFPAERDPGSGPG